MFFLLYSNHFYSSPLYLIFLILHLSLFLLHFPSFLYILLLTSLLSSFLPLLFLFHFQYFFFPSILYFCTSSIFLHSLYPLLYPFTSSIFLPSVILRLSFLPSFLPSFPPPPPPPTLPYKPLPRSNLISIL